MSDYQRLKNDILKDIKKDLDAIRKDLNEQMKQTIAREVAKSMNQQKSEQTSNALMKIDKNVIKDLSLVVTADVKKEMAKVLVPMNAKIQVMSKQIEEVMVDGDILNNDYRNDVYKTYGGVKKDKLTFLDDN
jgi:small-conductance mechanosensitive channel